MRRRSWILGALLAAGLARADEHGDAVFVHAPARPYLLLDARRRYTTTEHAHVYAQRRGGGSVRLALYRVREGRAFVEASVTRQGVSVAAGPWNADAEALLRGSGPMPRAGNTLTLVAQREVGTTPAPAPRHAVGDESAVWDSNENDEGAADTWGVSTGQWGAADVDLGALPAGTYLARVYDGMWATNALLSVGDTVLLTRRGDATDHVRVTDPEGRGLADVPVEGVAGTEIVRARTNADGDATLPPSAAPSRRVWALRGDDLAWTDVVHTQLPPCDTQVYLGTGRPVYRPGEAVSVRGHVRWCRPVAGARVRVFPTAAGATGETVTADADGNFSATLVAAANIGAEVDGRTHARTLTLDARPVPQTSLRLRVDRAWAAAGESVTVTAARTAHSPLPGVSFAWEGGRAYAEFGPDDEASATITLPPTTQALARFTVGATVGGVGEVLTARVGLWTGRTRDVLALTADTPQGAADVAHPFTLVARDLGGDASPGAVSLAVFGSDGNAPRGAPRWTAEAEPGAVRVRLAGAGPWWVTATRGEARAENVVWERPRPATLSGSGPFAVFPDAPSVAPGEPLRAAIRAAGPVWVTLEQGGVWASRYVTPTEGVARVSFDPPAGAQGLATLRATRVHAGRVETAATVAEVATSTRFALTLDPTRGSFAPGASARVIVRSRTTAGAPRDAVLSLWLEDVGWWSLGDERHPSVDAYFRRTGRPASDGDSTAPMGYGAEEGRRIDSGMFWNGERVEGTTFRHAWGHGGALINVQTAGDVGALATALARAAGMNRAEMCPARIRTHGRVRLGIQDLPWDLAAMKLAERTNTWVRRDAAGLHFACTPPAFGGGYGSGSGRGYGGGSVRAAPPSLGYERDQLTATQWFLAARRIGPTGELAVDVPMPDAPGRWRLHALAIADDGAGAQADADLDTVAPWSASLRVGRQLRVGDVLEGAVEIRSARRERTPVTVTVTADDALAMDAAVSLTLTPDADGVARGSFRLRGQRVGEGRVTARVQRDGQDLAAAQTRVSVRADAGEMPVDVRAVVTAEGTDVDLPIPALAGASSLRVTVDPSLTGALRAVLDELRAPRWDLPTLRLDRLASLRALSAAAATQRGADAAALRTDLARELEGAVSALAAMRGTDGAVPVWSGAGSAWVTATAVALGVGDATAWPGAWALLRSRAESAVGREAAVIAAALATGGVTDRARVPALLDRADTEDLSARSWALRAARSLNDRVRITREAQALERALDRTVSNDPAVPCQGAAWFLCLTREGTRGAVAGAARALLEVSPSARPSALRAARWLATHPEARGWWTWGSAEADVLALLARIGPTEGTAATLEARLGDTVLARGDARGGVTLTVRDAGTLRLSFAAAPGRFARVTVRGTLAVAPPSQSIGPAALTRTFADAAGGREMTLSFTLPRDTEGVEIHAPVPAGWAFALGAGERVAQRDPIRGWAELDGVGGDTAAQVSALDDGVRVRFVRLRAGAHAVRVPLAAVGRGRFRAGSAWLRSADEGVWSVTPAWATTAP